MKRYVTRGYIDGKYRKISLLRDFKTSLDRLKIEKITISCIMYLLFHFFLISHK